jgi:hypothetical protein
MAKDENDLKYLKYDKIREISIPTTGCRNLKNLIFFWRN